MIFQLPTKAPRTYRGKHPTRIHSWGYSNSPSQKAIGEFLGITKPVHIELNNGARYILPFALAPVTARTDVEFKFSAPVEIMTDERYAAMLQAARNA